MRNKYSDKISSLLDESRREAKRHRSNTVRPEHLLMALLKQRDSVTDRIMRQLNISKTDVTIDCENQLMKDDKVSTSTEQETDNDVYPDFDEKTDQLMKLAALEARMGRKDTVGLEHLLLAILHDVNNNQARSILSEY